MIKSGNYIFSVLFLTGIVFLFSSCGEKNYSVVIKNESTKPVWYEYNGEPSYTLDAGLEKKYEVKAYTQPPREIGVPGTMTVKMVKHIGDNYNFVDIDGSEIFDLKVYNDLDIDIILRADRYIDDLKGSNEMKIPAKKSEAGKVYIARPRFTTSPVQSKIDWNLNEEIKEITVTIRL